MALSSPLSPPLSVVMVLLRQREQLNSQILYKYSNNASE